MPKSALKSLWLDVTGDSHIIDIRLIRHPDIAVRYVTKYITKPLNAEVIRDPDALTQAILALAGRKTLFTFGTWARWQLLRPHDSGEWLLFSHVNALPFGLPADQQLRALIFTHYHEWAHHDGPHEFSIRAPPDPDLPDYDHDP